DLDLPAAEGSTGQQKALLVSIALAHARLVTLSRGRPPLLLLDEIAAHLDAERRAALFEEVVALGVQSWMTGTDAELFKPLAGGKFDSNSYKVSGGLHGVGAAVVNALSEYLDLRIWRNGKEYHMRFRYGDAEKDLELVGDAPEGKRGTEVTFLPSKRTFTNTEYDFATLEHRLRELAFLNSGVRIALCDERAAEPKISELF